MVRLRTVISLTDALIDISGYVLPLYDSPADCLKNDTFVIPPLSLLSSTSISLDPKEIKEIEVSILGVVYARHYSASSHSISLHILSPSFDLDPWRVTNRPSSVISHFSIFVHNEGDISLDFSPSQPIGILTPLVASATSHGSGRSPATSFYSHLVSYPSDGYLLYKSTGPPAQCDDDLVSNFASLAFHESRVPSPPPPPLPARRRSRVPTSNPPDSPPLPPSLSSLPPPPWTTELEPRDFTLPPSSPPAPHTPPRHDSSFQSPLPPPPPLSPSLDPSNGTFDASLPLPPPPLPMMIDPDSCSLKPDGFIPDDADSDVVKVDSFKTPAEAFPFSDPFQADESYHSGSCLIPRKLSEAELHEWDESVKNRHAYWNEDDCETLLSLFTLPELPPEILSEFKDLISEFSSVFGRDLNDLRTGMTRFLVHLEVIDDTKVMYSPARNLSLLISKATARYVKILNEAKIAEHSFSAHAANSFCVPKKERLPKTIEELDELDTPTFLSTFRFVQAFIKLNANLKVSNHSVSSLRQTILETRPNMIYSSVDLFQSFFQMVVDPKSRDFLSFHVPSLTASQRLTRPPMGLNASAQLLAAYLHRVAELDKLDNISRYYDDLSVCSLGWDVDEEELESYKASLSPGHRLTANANYGLDKLTALRAHLDQLRKFFTTCMNHNIILNPRKCSFFARVVERLGFQISPFGISVPDRLRESICKLRTPTSRTEVRSLLGLANVISAFIPGYIDIVSPLYQLTSTRKPFAWTPDHDQAFESLKRELHHLPLLAFFHYKNSKGLILFTDASDVAGAGILMLELLDGSRLPISYCSSKFPLSSLKQSIFRKEFYALAAGLRKNEDILRCIHFTLYIDSKALYFALNNPRVKLTEQIYRLNDFVQSFAYTTKWIPSKSNLADILTRQVSDDIPVMDLSFLASFRKDMTVMGWVDDEGDIFAPLQPSETNALFWDQVPCADSLPTGETFAKFPEAADSSSSDARGAAPPDTPPSVPLSPAEGHDAQDLVAKHLADEPFNHPPHQTPLPPSQDPDDGLPLPAMLRVFSRLDFVHATQKDPDLQLFSEILSRRQPLPDPTFLQRSSKSLQLYVKQKELYSLDRGLVFREIVGENHSHFALVVPDSLRSSLVAQIHLRYGHPGIDSTLMSIKRAYWFPNLIKSVRAAVLNCSVCLQYKERSDKTYVGEKLDPSCSRPWETIAVDHFSLGQAPHLRSPFTAVLISVDVFSGFVVAENVKSLSSGDTVNALKKIFEAYGVPQNLRSDNATSFKNAEIQAFLKGHGVTHIFSIPYTPSSNGVAERYVKSLKTKLRVLMAPIENKFWHQYTKTATFALNSAIRPSLGYSPREIFFGTPPFIDGTHLYASPSSFRGQVGTYLAQREKFFDAINEARWGLVDKSTPRSIPPSFEPGQKCFVRNFTISLSPNKQLDQKFLGPFTIVKKLNAFSYLIDREGNGESIVHVNNIRPFFPEFDPNDRTLKAEELPLAAGAGDPIPMDLISDSRIQSDHHRNPRPISANSDRDVRSRRTIKPILTRSRTRRSASAGSTLEAPRHKRGRSSNSSSDADKQSRKIARVNFASN